MAEQKKKQQTKENTKTKNTKQTENKTPFTTKVKNKVDTLTVKQIFLYSLIWFIGLALWFYFKDKEKDKAAFKGTLFGVLIIFCIGLIWGVISCLLKM